MSKSSYLFVCKANSFQTLACGLDEDHQTIVTSLTGAPRAYFREVDIIKGRSRIEPIALRRYRL